MVEDELEQIIKNDRQFNAFLQGYRACQEVRLNATDFDGKQEFEEYLRQKFKQLVLEDDNQ